MSKLTAVFVIAAPLALTTPPVLGQTTQQPAAVPTCASATSTAVDVASVKPIDQSSDDFDTYGHADSLKVDGIVSKMIELAYNIQTFQLSGGPGWLTTATWDVTAKVDHPPANYDALSTEARGALQSQRMAAVLAQRFALRCHFETRQLPVYRLVLAKGALKLTPTPPNSTKKGSFSVHGDNYRVRMEAVGVPVETLASKLSRLGRSVVDKTGLTGIYSFTLIYSRDQGANSSASADASSSPTVFTALEEQLGLKLEPAKGPVPILIIDSIARPSEN